MDPFISWGTRKLTRLIVVTTEDSTDNDDNDTFVTISVVLPLTTDFTNAQSVKSTHTLAASPESGSALSFVVGDVNISVGAFSCNSTTTAFTVFHDTWGKVIGEITDNVSPDPRFHNVLFLRFALSESTVPEFQNSTLKLQGILPYMGTRPVGTPSGVQWTTSLA